MPFPKPEESRRIDPGKKDGDGKIAVLTHWVADNIRYSGISMGKGEGYTLHNLKMNYTDRCGVCKDIAGTLIAFLRMAGFEAYPAMTMAGSRVESIPADHFNHCVAVVKLSSGTYMPLDPTWVPSAANCGAVPNNSKTIYREFPKVPISVSRRSAPENHYVRIKATTLGCQSTLTGQFTITAEGQSDSNIRRIFTTGCSRNGRPHWKANFLPYHLKLVLSAWTMAKTRRTTSCTDQNDIPL